MSIPSILSSISKPYGHPEYANAPTESAVKDVVKQILSKTTIDDIDLIIVHFSSEFDIPQLSKLVFDQFPDATIAGCSSAGEFNQNGYVTQSLVIIAFLKSDFTSAASVVSNIDQLNFDRAYQTASSLREKLNNKGQFEPDECMVLSFLDGLTMNEEGFLQTFGSVFGSIPHFGGSAGDDLKLEVTFVIYNGEVHENAAVIVLIGCKRPFEIFSSDHIQTPVSKMVVTKADQKTRTVYELNGEPAAEYYAKLLGKKLEELTPDVFSVFPLAVMVGSKYYVRSLQKVDPQSNSLTFYCAVDLGMILTFVQLGDCSESLSNQLNELKMRLGPSEFVYGCDCFLRRLENVQRGKKEDIKQLQKEYNISGFSAYGEHIDSIHLNQTFTGVYFAKSDDNSK